MYDFKFKPFNEMTDDDYAEVGFKSGLEVHQQLLTEKKLFCRCPAGKYSNEYNAEILRHMRPTLSELGEYDGTALMEFKTKKDIIYRINRETVCTYEMDDTPPFEINDQALDIAIQIGMMYNANTVDEIHIARKQYLDGSIPTGFQRTAIVNVGGSIPYKNKEINIIQMSIEEDSCREASDVGHRRVYMTDRLGMPLIETVTHPDMKTPQQVADVCNIIRRIVRSTGNVRTGIGAAREDVNVSVRGGTRIEIKGVPRIVDIPLLTYNEAMRQWNLLKLREELKNRGITEKTFEARTDDVTKLLTKSKYTPIANAIAEGKYVKCVTLKGFKGLLKWQTQTNTFFSKEIADRVRVIACLTTLPNITHSDSDDTTITSAEGQAIRKQVVAAPEDALVLVWGDEQDSTLAAKEIIIRAKEATIGIPSETRQALDDGTNGFERILPGADRMYPDTDLPPKRITEERLARIRKTLPTPFWVNEAWYEQLQIPKDVIKPLAISRFAKIFETAVKEWKLDAKFLSVVLVQHLKRLKKKGLKTDRLKADAMEKILEAYKNKKIIKEAIIIAMENVIVSGEFSEELLPLPCTDAEFKATVEKAVNRLKNTDFYNPIPENKAELLTGYVLNRLRGKIDGEKVSSYASENINKLGL